MENLTIAFQRERKRSILYDNIHAGGIVTEKNRAENAEQVLGEQVFQLEFVLFVLFVFVSFLFIFLFILCRNNGRRARFKSCCR